MTTHTSSTAGNISPIAERLKQAVGHTKSNMSKERIERMENLSARRKNLGSRGLAKRQRYGSLLSAEFKRFERDIKRKKYSGGS